MLRFFSLITALVLFVNTYVPVFAQSEPISLESSPSVALGQIGDFSCYSQFSPTSVVIDIDSSLSQTVPGTPFNFSGTITNTNDYPIVDARLLVKILRVADGGVDEVVDQFVVGEDFSLPAQGQRVLNHEWVVPQYADGGDYYAAYTLTTAAGFAVTGTAAATSDFADIASFSITATSSLAKFTTADVTINGESYEFTARPQVVSAADTLVVEATLVNLTGEAKTLPVQWRQYNHPSLAEADVVATVTEIITLEPNETKLISYTVKEQREATVFVTAITEDRGVKSYLNISLVKDTVAMASLDFMGLSAFPVAANTEITGFACARSLYTPVVDGNTLTIEIADQFGEIVNRYQYAGELTTAGNGFGNSFVASGDYDYLVLTATLERDGVVYEEASVVYDCQAIDAASCISGSDEDGGGLFDMIIANPILFFGGVIVLLLLLYLVWSVHKRHHNNDSNITAMNNTSGSKLVLLLLIVPALFFSTAGTVAAKAVTWDGAHDAGAKIKYFNGTNSYFQANYPSYRGYIQRGLPENIAVTYEATVRDVATNTFLSDGSTISVGTELEFAPKAFANEDISLSGEWYHSISGIWNNTTASVGVSCNPERWHTFYQAPGQGVGDSIGGSFTMGARHDLFLDPVFARPSVSYVHSGTATLNCNALGNICTVASAGTISSSVVFSSTQARFYERESNGNNVYYAGPPVTTGCRGDDTPMNITPQPLAQEEQSLIRYCYIVPTSATNDFKCQLRNTGSPYTLTVPQQMVTFNLNVTGGNTAPAAPSVNVAACTVSQPTTITISGTDPDGDRVFYEIDWDNNGTVDQRVPASGFVDSGTSQTVSRTWSSAGTKNFQVRTQDENGAVSGWTTGSASCTAAPAATTDLKVNNSDGPLTVGKTTDLTLSWNHANAGTCNIYGEGLPSGQLANVGSTGSHVISGGTVGAGTESYALTCTSGTDSVAVTITNQPPNAPNIAGPTSAAEADSNTFSFTATDPDGDRVFYEVDWDNNGTVDVATPGTGYVNSGVSSNASRAWSTDGTYTFRARTVDFDNARSTWTTHTITITAGPPATASLEVSINGGGWNSNDATVGAQDTLRFRWSSTNAASCSTSGTTSGSGFGTGGLTSGSDSTINTPSAGNNSTFQVNCDGATARIVITSELADLSIAAWSLDVDDSSFDEATLTYANAIVRFTHSNVTSLSAVPNTTATLDHNGGFTAATPGLAGGEEYVGQVSMPITNVPLGTFSADLTVNQPQSVNEKTRANNTATVTDSVPPPNPGLFIHADRIQVRPNDTVVLTWGATNPYPMNCRVTGPGVDIIRNNAVPGGTTAPNNNPAITAKSEYTLTCIESTTNTTYTASVIVETVGILEEV